MSILVTMAACAVLVVALLGAYALGGGRQAETVSGTTAAPVRQITSAGSGTASGKPDVMRFTVGVDVTRSDVDAAVDASNALMKKVLARTRSFDVGDKDIRTTRYAIEPRYDYSGNTERLTGYAVTQRARITLRDLTKAGAAVSAIASAGGNDVRIDAIGFEVSEPDALRNEARTSAVADARARAETLARAAGATLGDVIEVTEGAPRQRNETVAYAALAAKADSAPIEAGESELDVNVSVTWSLE